MTAIFTQSARGAPPRPRVAPATPSLQSTTFPQVRDLNESPFYDTAWIPASGFPFF